MSKHDPRKIQTCILKVNIHCDGCEQKVKKRLQKIDGVYSVSTDAEQGKVVVTGDVEPAKLINKLKRSGKHAEIWGGQRGMMFNQNYPINPQFQNLQGGKDNMSQNQKGQKSGGQLAQFQNTKGPQDLKVPTKQHNKSVKFNIPNIEFDDDNFDYYDEVEGHGHGNPMMNNMMPVLGNPNGPAGMMNVPNMNNHKGYDSGNYYGSTKKVDVIDMPMQVKGKGGNYYEVKSGNDGGMKSNVDLGVKNKEDEKHKGSGGVDYNNYKKKNAKSEGGLLGRFLGFGKKRSKLGVAHTNMNNTNKNNINVKEVKKGGEKLEGYSTKKSMSDENDDYFDFDIPNLDKNAKSGNGKGSNGNGNGTNVGQMGPMKQKGPMGQMENVPAMNSGGGEYHQGMQMQPAPYNLQQQQYMAMMMNQQQQQANMNMYPPAMMHGRPYPSMNYMPPPPMPSHPMADPMTHVFSDENTQGYCNIM